MKKSFTALTALLVVLIAGTAIFVATLDANRYRGQIAEALGKQTGRTIKLGGPIKLGFSWQGVTIDIQDAGIGNPFWASRPMMAGIGRFDLGVALMPLFERQFVITRLAIANADIELETDRNGRHNWDMSPAEHPNATGAPNEKTKAKSGPVSIQIEKISIDGSQLTFHDQEGKTDIFKVDHMTLGAEGGGIALHFAGAYDNAPVTLSVNTGAHDIFASTGSWPFEANLAYANYKLRAKGTADIGKKRAAVSSYDLSAGKSDLHGELTANWEGARSSVRGTLLGDHLDPADFKAEEKNTKSAAGENEGGGGSSKRVFSDKPLGLDGLKSSDADLDIGIGELVVGNGVLKQINAKLSLHDGILSLDPLKAMLGTGVVEGQIKLNGAISPPQLAAALTAPDIKLEDLLNLLGAPDFLSGKANANINLASSGDSPHALASNAVGVINVAAAGGNVSSSAASDIASGLMELFAPGGSNNLNCLAARFIVKDGVAHDNGILADTSATTVAGNGEFDLGRETVDIILRARSKQVDVGGLVPPLRVSGGFLDLKFRIDPSETIQRVAGILNGSSLDSTVPTIITQPGQNACIYTLDHPSSATSSKSVMPGTLTGKVNAGIGNIGKALKGFLGQ